MSMPPMHRAGARTFVWTPSETIKTRDAKLVAREREPVLVRVTKAAYDVEATIYGEGRSKLKYQVLSKAEQEMLGNDEVAFFIAAWSVENVKWNLLQRAPKGARW